MFLVPHSFKTVVEDEEDAWSPDGAAFGTASMYLFNSVAVGYLAILCGQPNENPDKAS